MKTCTSCIDKKPATEFYRRAKSPDGLALVCKACSGLKAREHYEREKCAAKARAKKWAAQNPARRKDIARLSAEKHIEKKRAFSREYNKRKRAESPDAAREAGRRQAAMRRSREKGAGGAISAADWQMLFDLFETNVCLYCGSTDSKLTMDHWMPVVRGGKTELGNLLPCCKSCNSRKGDKHPDEWLKTLPTRAESVSIPQFLAITREVV